MGGRGAGGVGVLSRPGPALQIFDKDGVPPAEPVDLNHAAQPGRSQLLEHGMARDAGNRGFPAIVRELDAR